MFTYKTTIRLKDTDATGVLYFTEQLRMAEECFEAYLSSHGKNLHTMLQKDAYLLPIVHAEADYFSPLKLGDEIEIFCAVKHRGTTSITFHYRLCKKGQDVGTVSITHVCIDRISQRPISLPEEDFFCSSSNG